MAVVRATRRLKVLSRRSSSSSGLGSSISATRWRLANLVAHGILAGLERRHQTLRLLLEQLATLVEPLAGAPLSVTGHFLRALGHLVAALGQDFARLAARLRRHEQRGDRSE